MKLHRFCGTLLDLHLIATINCSAEMGEYGNSVNIHITFILGAPEIKYHKDRGSGLGGGEGDRETINYYKAEIEKLEKVWEESKRVIPADPGFA